MSLLSIRIRELSIWFPQLSYHASPSPGRRQREDLNSGLIVPNPALLQVARDALRAKFVGIRGWRWNVPFLLIVFSMIGVPDENSYQSVLFFSFFKDSLE